MKDQWENSYIKFHKPVETFHLLNPDLMINFNLNIIEFFWQMSIKHYGEDSYVCPVSRGNYMYIF